MVDTADLKSAGGDSVPVRVRSAAPEKEHPSGVFLFCIHRCRTRTIQSDHWRELFLVPNYFGRYLLDYFGGNVVDVNQIHMVQSGIKNTQLLDAFELRMY